ncbi:hypothetical protein AB0D90_28290, partial [Streptomyces althioticus]
GSALQRLPAGRASTPVAPGQAGQHSRGPGHVGNPKTFIRKQLDNDDLGLKEIRNGFDLKKEMAEVTDAVHGRDTDPSPSPATPGGRVDMTKKPEKPAADDRPPFDMDAT